MWSIFAPLVRTLTGGHSAKPQAVAYSFEMEWAGLLDRLKLPSHILRDVVTTGSLEPHFRYWHYHKSKKTGGRREISEPDANLKQLQHEIIRRYFVHEHSHPAAVAYQVGRSAADHVWEHAGAEVVIIADIQDFFPNTHVHRVEDWWRARVDDDTARLLTLLTTDRDGLPQGAPTSPGLSNFVNAEFDTRLANLATLAGARYTRYCDDLAFSWSVGAGPPGGFDARVRMTLHEFGYALHPTKGWRVHTRRDEPEMTGVILTRHGGVRLPERLEQVMRKLARSTDPHAATRLEGYEGYQLMVTRNPKRRRNKKHTARAASRPAPPLPRRAEPRPPASADDEIPF